MSPPPPYALTPLRLAVTAAFALALDLPSRRHCPRTASTRSASPRLRALRRQAAGQAHRSRRARAYGRRPPAAGRYAPPIAEGTRPRHRRRRAARRRHRREGPLGRTGGARPGHGRRRLGPALRAVAGPHARGLCRGAFAALEIPPRSPALNALWRRLITSNVPAPAGTEADVQFTALRVEALDRSGLIDEAGRGACQGSGAARATRCSPRSWRAARSGSATASRAARPRKRPSPQKRQMPQGLKGEAILIAGYCAAAARRHGRRRAAGRARARARPRRLTSAPTCSTPSPAAPSRTCRRTASCRSSTIASPSSRAASDRALSSARHARPARGAGARPRHAARSQARGRREGRRGQRHRAGRSRALYRRLGRQRRDAGTSTRAALFKSAESERTPLKKARTIRAFLDEARRAGLYWPALHLMEQAGADARARGRDRLVCRDGGRGPSRRRQFRAGARVGAVRLVARCPARRAHRGGIFRTGSRSPTSPIPAVKPGGAEHLESVEEMAVSGQFDPVVLHRLATVLDALDINVPIPLWDVASRTPQPASGHLPDTGVLSELADASKKKEFGRTVLLAMRTLGPGRRGRRAHHRARRYDPRLEARRPRARSAPAGARRPVHELAALGQQLRRHDVQP